MNKLIGAQNIEITYENHIMTAKILGDIDHHSARSVREKIDALIFSKRPSMVVLDLSAVEFMDSSGLGLILGRYTNAQEAGAEFLIYKPTRRVRKILELAGIERIIQIEGDSRNEAC